MKIIEKIQIIIYVLFDFVFELQQIFLISDVYVLIKTLDIKLLKYHV